MVQRKNFEQTKYEIHNSQNLMTLKLAINYYISALFTITDKM